MDIWAWVQDARASLQENGFDRLVEIVDRLPYDATGGHAAAVEAAVPEALALAKAARAPWVEVFVRHWSLQSRVTDQSQGEAALLDAVDALDKAHADDTAGCPQSVCTVQDVCLAYGATDGPAYVDERLAVCDETLARIDPSWPCWMCLTQEKADALLDAGRFAEARELVEERVATLPGSDSAADLLLPVRVGAALGLGDTAAAMAAVEEAEAAPSLFSGRNRLRLRTLTRARALVAAGRPDEAMATLPPAGELTPAQYVVWAEVRVAIERAGHHPLTAADRRLVRRWRGELVERGSWHNAQALAAQLVRSSAAAGSLAVAARDLDRFDAIVVHRRYPEREKDLQAELSDAVVTATPWAVILPADPDQLPPPPWAAPPGSLATAPGGEPDLEAEIEMLTSAARRWPDHEGVILRLAGTWAAVGDHHMAKSLLVARLREHPTSEAAHRLGTIMLDAGEDGLRSVEDDIRRADPYVAEALWARLLHERSDWEGSVARCQAALAIDPDALGTRRRLIDALVRCGRYDESLAQARQVVAEADPPAGHDRWAVIIAASAVGAWGDVRSQSLALGWPVDAGEAPMDEPLERCLVRFPDGTHEAVDRTGPATGVVVSISGPDARQRYGWRVLIEPTPVGDPGSGAPELADDLADGPDGELDLDLELDADLGTVHDLDRDDRDREDSSGGEPATGIDIGMEDLDDLDEWAQLAGIDELESLEDLDHLDTGGTASAASEAPHVPSEPEPPEWATYPLLGVLEEVDAQVFEVIGVWIDQVAWLGLRTRIEDTGAAAWIHAAGFDVDDLPGTSVGAPAQGMLASVAVPAGTDLGPLWAAIRDAHWPGPLAAPLLAMAVGDPESAARHRATAAAFGF